METPYVSAGGVNLAPSVDVTSEKDQGLVRTAMRFWGKRWKGITDELKEQWVEDLRLSSVAGRELLKSGDLVNGTRALTSVVKTAAVLEAQNQSDDQLDRKEALAAKQSGGNVTITLKSGLVALQQLNQLHQSNGAALESTSPPSDPTENNAPQNGNGRHG